MATISDHDAYIAAVPEAFRSSLVRLRSILALALPEAEEIVAYNMPGFRIDGSIIAGYAAFSKQCGLYLHADALSKFANEVADAGLKATKTGITFKTSNPIPDDLVKQLAQASREAARR